jgi:hypothetical protein
MQVKGDLGEEKLDSHNVFILNTQLQWLLSSFILNLWISSIFQQETNQLLLH